MLRSNLGRVGLGFAVLLSLGVVTVGATTSMLGDGRICRGVSIAGVEVGGATREEAVRRLRNVVEERESRPVTFALESRVWRTTFRDLGGRIEVYRAIDEAMNVGREGSFLKQWNDRLAALRGQRPLALPVRYAPAKIQGYLESVAKEVDRPAVRAGLKETAGGLAVVPEQAGLKLDVRATAEATLKAIESPSAQAIPLKMAADLPALTASDLSGIDTVLASYTTSFRRHERARTHNLTLAAREIDGSLLAPGEVFSYNETVGPRLKSLGYRDAIIFVDGEQTPGTGGGICQVSSTLYNAALLSGMKIVARSHHSLPVRYTPKGRDATVAYGGLDFKFENTAAHPAYLSSKVNGGQLTVKIWGHASDRREVEILTTGGRSVPGSVVTRPDPNLLEGKRVVERSGHSGYRVTTIRVTRSADGAARREVVSSDYYRPQATVVRVGTRPAPPQPEENAESTPSPAENPAEMPDSEPISPEN
ncbi:MAG: VanW family protein [Armatimonadetes bacterium]|nr:VanW family protein [Armatimonadota bacterium]